MKIQTKDASTTPQGPEEGFGQQRALDQEFLAGKGEEVLAGSFTCFLLISASCNVTCEGKLSSWMEAQN